LKQQQNIFSKKVHFLGEDKGISDLEESMRKDEFPGDRGEVG